MLSNPFHFCTSCTLVLLDLSVKVLAGYTLPTWSLDYSGPVAWCFRTFSEYLRLSTSGDLPPITIPFLLSIYHLLSIHPMQTRSKSSIFNPCLNSTLLLTYTKPSSIVEALVDSKWLVAMRNEFKALQRNNTWPLV